MEEQRAHANERAAAYAAFASLLTSPPDGEQAQTFFDRIAVPCSAIYVPLFEQCICDAVHDSGRWTFGPLDGGQTRHVVRCYERAGFDYRRLGGYEPIVRSLRPDALAAECAFMAFLLTESANADRIAYADAFLLAHLAPWTGKAAHICEEAGDDWVSSLVADCAAFVTKDARNAESVATGCHPPDSRGALRAR